MAQWSRPGEHQFHHRVWCTMLSHAMLSCFSWNTQHTWHQSNNQSNPDSGNKICMHCCGRFYDFWIRMTFGFLLSPKQQTHTRQRPAQIIRMIHWTIVQALFRDSSFFYKCSNWKASIIKNQTVSVHSKHKTWLEFHPHGTNRQQSNIVPTYMYRSKNQCLAYDSSMTV